MEQLLLPVRATRLGVWRGGRQVGRLLLQEVGVRLSVRVRVHPAAQAAVGRLGGLLLLGRRRRRYWHIMERCVDGGGTVLLLGLHAGVMIQTRVQELKQRATVVVMEAVLVPR